MTSRQIQNGLRHTWGMKDEAFFAMIDATGGWPAGFRYVGFEHTDERNAGFCNSPHNDGWWTVLFDADDYYLWKLSPDALQRIIGDVVARLRQSIPEPAASTVWFRSSGRSRAVTQAKIPSLEGDTHG